MSSRTLLAQDDFSSLGLAAGHDAESQPIVDYDGLTNIERAEGVGSLNPDSACESDKIYYPVNFIPDEVYKLIREWEVTYMQRHESIQTVDAMDTQSLSDLRSSESSEPIRCMSVSQAPPKRFYRTFWRSVARRIIQLDKQSTLKRNASSRSDGSNDWASVSAESDQFKMIRQIDDQWRGE